MEKVSRIDGGVIESKYISLKYLPSEDGSNPNLNGKCNVLITAFVLADANGDNDDLNFAMKSFCEALLACKTEEEINNFALFMNKLGDLGGFARIFNGEVKSIINQAGKKTAQNILQNINKEEQNKNEEVKNKPVENRDNSKLKNFENLYAQLNYELEKFRKKPMVNDKDLSLLLEMYEILRGNLYNIKGEIDNQSFTQYDGQINDVINNLRSISESLKDIDRPITR